MGPVSPLLGQRPSNLAVVGILWEEAPWGEIVVRSGLLSMSDSYLNRSLRGTCDGAPPTCRFELPTSGLGQCPGGPEPARGQRL